MSQIYAFSLSSPSCLLSTISRVSRSGALLLLSVLLVKMQDANLQILVREVIFAHLPMHFITLVVVQLWWALVPSLRCGRWPYAQQFAWRSA